MERSTDTQTPDEDMPSGATARYGRRPGLATRRDDLVALLSLRGIDVGAARLEEIGRTEEAGVLDLWFSRAGVAQTAEEVFGGRR